MTNDELIKSAENVLNPHTTKDNRLFGDVGAALISGKGKLYTGTCIDTTSWGLCAERSAVAAMVTAKEYKIKKIVAVWKNPKNEKLYALPPCGACRDFIRRVDEGNLETEVILGKDKTLKLKELLPYYEWPEPLD